MDTTCEGVLAEFREYFAAPGLRKIYHNYSFDKAILSRALWRATGAEPAERVLRGFHADTMHMSRLQDAGRLHHSLAHLTSELLEERYQKTPMKEKFSRPFVKKDGTLSKRLVMPSTVELQEEHKEAWVEYCTGDTVATWKVSSPAPGGGRACAVVEHGAE